MLPHEKNCVRAREFSNGLWFWNDVFQLDNTMAHSSRVQLHIKLVKIDVKIWYV